MGVVEVLDPVQPMRAGGWKVDASRGERNGRVSSEWFEYDHLTSDEAIEEGIIVNEHTFTEAGRRFG